MIPQNLMMYIVDYKFNLRFYVREILYFLAATFIAVGLNYSFSDDGLRHLAFAQHHDIMKSWGQAYPNSLFSNYDLWGSWHLFLEWVISISSFEYAHIIVNIISLFILMSLMDQLFQIELKKYKNTIPMIVVILLTVVYARYINIRPDLLSGFFIMLIYIFFRKYQEKELYFLFGLFLISVLYSSTYYLFFVYTLMLSMYFFIVSNYKATLVLLAATLFSFCCYYLFHGYDYFQYIYYVLIDSSLRQGALVGEGLPLLKILAIVDVKYQIAFYLLVVLILKIKFNNFLKTHLLFSLLLASSLLWIGQMRYTQLLYPVFSVIFVSSFLNITKNSLYRLLRKLQFFYIKFSRGMQRSNKNIAFIIIFTIFISFEMGVSLKNIYAGKMNSIQNVNQLLNDFNITTEKILFTSLDEISYQSLYTHPEIKEVPSCSIGWFSGSSREKELYFKMIKKRITAEELSELAILLKVDFIILEMPVSENNIFNLKYFNENGFKILNSYGENILISVLKY